MTEIPLQISCAQVNIAIGSITRNKTVIALDAHGGFDGLLFWKESLVAVSTGGVVHWHMKERTSAGKAAINSFFEDAPHINCSAEQFDFVVGSLLTKIGLPLTKRLK